MWYISVSSGTVVSAKSKPPPELPPEPTAEGINICLKNIQIIMFDIAISSNYTVHNTYQDVFSWLKNRDPNETHVYSLKKKILLLLCFLISRLLFKQKQNPSLEPLIHQRLFQRHWNNVSRNTSTQRLRPKKRGNHQKLDDMEES